MNAALGKRLATALLPLLAGLESSGSDLIGFWDFKGGADGAAVTTIANVQGEAVYTSDAARKSQDASGRVPTFSANGPGRVVDSSGGRSLCDDPWAIDFFYADRASHQSGYLDIPGLADRLSELTAYTIEYFIRFDPDFNYYDADAYYAFISKTPLYVQSGAVGYKLIAPRYRSTASGNPLGIGLETYANDCVASQVFGSGTDYGDGLWHHVAAVYAETNATERLGALSLFVDGVEVGSGTYANIPGTGLKFRLGTGYLNAAGQDKTATESIHASLACLRVTGSALSADAFMKIDSTPYVGDMETAGFWDFKEGADGETIAALSNTVDAALFPGTAAATTERTPTFSAERPGRFVYASGRLLAENPQSAYFGTADDYGVGGKIELASLATALTRLDAYTVEFFFKIDQPVYRNWRSLVGWRTGDASAVKINLTGDGSQYTAATFEVLTNATANSVDACARSARVDVPLGDSWHHFAVVHSRADNAAWIYIDRIRSTASAALTNALPTTQHPFVLGNSALAFKQAQEAFGGWISCVRVTPRALPIGDFMTATERPVPAETVFALNFDEGTAGTVVSEARTGATSVSVFPDLTTCEVGYNLHDACRPQYADTEKAGRLLKWGRLSMWTNRLCLWFPAASHLPEGAANAVYYGAMLNVPARTDDRSNPSSWTMEAFVKLERAGLPQAQVKQGLIFGKAGNATPLDNTKWPRSAWLLSYNGTGNLVLEWTERPHDDYADYAAGSSYFKKVTTPTAFLQDLKWHHVALSYDAAEKRFALHVDGACVLVQPLQGTEDSNALYDGPFAYYFCRFPTTGGFEGWMDEIRFSSKVL
ncbi:MAG: LamG-like jellyroll fold domain-containing protein [Kiritimatiellia bacterium]